MTKKYRSRQTQATQRQLHWAYTTSSTCPTHQVQRLKSSQAVKSNKENNSTINSIFQFYITLIKLYIVEWLSLIRNSTKSDEETLHIRPHNSERKWSGQTKTPQPLLCFSRGVEVEVKYIKYPLKDLMTERTSQERTQLSFIK